MPNTLFSQSYLEAGLRETEEYQQISPSILSHFGQDLRAPYSAFTRAYQASNEAQIEDALIRPALNALGWSYLPQQPIPVSGRTPDYMLFADDDDRAAFTGGGDISRYPLAPAEAKAWEPILTSVLARSAPAHRYRITCGSSGSPRRAASSGAS